MCSTNQQGRKPVWKCVLHREVVMSQWNGNQILKCWKEVDERRGWRKDERAEELIRKVKTCCRPTTPEWAEEIWRQFNSHGGITKHAAMWDAEKHRAAEDSLQYDNKITLRPYTSSCFNFDSELLVVFLKLWPLSNRLWAVAGTSWRKNNWMISDIHVKKSSTINRSGYGSWTTQILIC